MSIHINDVFHNRIFDALHYKNAFEISVSKIWHELSILCNFQDSDDIGWLHYQLWYYTMIFCCFRLDPISGFGNFSLYFPTMAPEKACVVTLSEVVFGVHDYGARNILFLIASGRSPCLGVRMPDALGLHGALGFHGWGEALL